MSNFREQIDWTPFDKYSESTVTCVCGHTYRSHAKFVMAMVDGRHVGATIARKACAMCGGERMTAARSDPETQTL